MLFVGCPVSEKNRWRWRLPRRSCADVRRGRAAIVRPAGGLPNNRTPDMVHLAPEGLSFKREMIRQRLQTEAPFQPRLAATRVAVLERVDRMTEEAANSFLKTAGRAGSAMGIFADG